MSDEALLRSLSWRTSYRHEDGDLVELFFIPALSCAYSYDRMTGYFSAEALSLAARGIDQLIQHEGRMRLIIGCTLDKKEIDAIEAGYDLRKKIEEKFTVVSLNPADETGEYGLSALAWLIARGQLDVRVAIPIDARGIPTLSAGIYHEKVGIISDSANNHLVFSGSINETAAGWLFNRESFHVHCDWEGGREKQHVDDELKAFSLLWCDEAKATKTYEFPEAARRKLLEFLPKEDKFVIKKYFPGRGIVKEQFSDKQVSIMTWRFLKQAWTFNNSLRLSEATSAISAWPHQQDALVRVIKFWPTRVLIADEVGLGKTITAGLIVRHLLLSKKASRILILAPKAVTQQWQNELYEKFNLNIPVYEDGFLFWRASYGRKGPIEQKVSRKEWCNEPVVIVSSHLVRRRERTQELTDAENWDLILLDEAHHARRKGAGGVQESGPNTLLSLMGTLKDKCRGLILMTATPMQVHPVEVWDLLNLLGLPPEWNAETFVKYFEVLSSNDTANNMEFLATMFRNVENSYGAVTAKELETLLPQFNQLDRQKITKAVRDKSTIPFKRLDARLREAVVHLLQRYTPVRFLMMRQTRELLRYYYKQGLLDCPIQQRDPRDIAVELSSAERLLYDEVESYITATYNKASSARRNAVGFVMTIYRRRLASSFYSLRQTLNNRLAQLVSPKPLLVTREDLSDDELAEKPMEEEDAEELSKEALEFEERDRIQDLLKGIAKLGTDSKAKRLKLELESAFMDGFDSAIIFTQFTDTLDYLKNYIFTQMPGLQIGCYSGRGGERIDAGGQWSQCTKEAIKLALKKKEIQLLLCTDAAGEGLNLQFCGVVINYDLPWNPMKLEQRIGRIDRIGQKFPVIRIVNLAYSKTVEADVYFALGKRINLFQGVVGKLQPILSRLPKEFARVALEPRARQEEAKNQLLSEMNQFVVEAEQSAFDIDTVGSTIQQTPLPNPPFDLNGIDNILADPTCRPDNWEWQPLDQRTYSVGAVGNTAVRATTSAEVFEDHSDSHVFLSPAGELFELMSSLIMTHPPICDDDQRHHYWIATNNSTGCRRILAKIEDTWQNIDTLELLKASYSNVQLENAPLEEIYEDESLSPWL